MLPFKFIEKINNYETTLDEAIEDQVELEILINKLSTDYNARSLKEKRREKLHFRICKKIVWCKKRYCCVFFKKSNFSV